ncbi:hypothetical protein [Spiroplasma citri]|uniref:hypothetical protein n=1 Tax=Spiroplasma citri TaxID=2133 RepID=UPI0011BB9DF3|nr:hypothetical protein [Spiroplasma citri]QED25582.1 hypothetical protein FRX96_09895 [Spiroplasma citri]
MHHGSRNGKIFAVGNQKEWWNTIWIYDADSKQHLKSEIWQGQYLINLYQCEWNKMLEAIKINQEALK